MTSQKTFFEFQRFEIPCLGGANLVGIGVMGARDMAT